MTLRQALDEQTANSLRGETELLIGGVAHVLRPSFTALVAAEEELGALFALVERAGAGQLPYRNGGAFLALSGPSRWPDARSGG